MNKQRRKELSALATRWDVLKGELEQLRDDLNQVREAEDEAYNNLPDSVRDGDKGSQMSEFVDAMQTGVDALSSLVDDGPDFDNMYDAE